MCPLPCYAATVTGVLQTIPETPYHCYHLCWLTAVSTSEALLGAPGS